MAREKYSNRVAFAAISIVAWYSVSWSSHKSTERPVQSIFIALVVSSAILTLVARYYPRDSGLKDEDASSRGLPSVEDGTILKAPSSPTQKWLIEVPPQQLQKRRHASMFVIACVVLRVATLRHVLEEPGCPQRGTEAIILPLLLAIDDCFIAKRSISKTDEISLVSNSIFQDIYGSFIHSRARYILPVLVLSFGVYVNGLSAISSTYICPVASNKAYSVGVSQILGVFLDAAIIMITWRLMTFSDDSTTRLKCIKSLCVNSAAALGSLSIISVVFDHGRALVIYTPGFAYMWSAVVDGFAFGIVLLCILYLASELRPSHLAFLFVFASEFSSLALASWPSRAPFPPPLKATKSFGLLLSFIGFIMFVRIFIASEASQTSYNFGRRIPAWLYAVLLILVGAVEISYLTRRTLLGSHPIDDLVHNARIESDRWLVHSSSSISLETAVTEYQSRYRGRSPPPNFDKWYEFATKRGCAVMDNYDQIDSDLLPFWGLEPAEIRLRTPHQVHGSNIVTIVIRNGRAEVGIMAPKDNEGEERWVRDTVEMINNFSQWLPDMAIAINVGDWPRSAVHWKKVDSLRHKALGSKVKVKPGQHNQFSSIPVFESGWGSVEQIEVGKYASRKTHTFHDDYESYPSLFNKYQSSICPSNPLLSRSRAWSKQEFCLSCASPHSLGQFVSNVTLASDICHQPDMGKLFSFQMEPYTENSGPGVWTDTLVPIFSRSKISGYNDILFPCPGDYVDLSQPRPNNKSFSEMQDVLFWRGPADEGVSASREWRGMQQQRLVHLANNITSNTKITMLLPATKENKFMYENVLVKDLEGFLKMDIGFTKIDLCGPSNCEEQKQEFGTRPEVPFEKHWDYRYLFDMDVGGGPSENFIPFLRSNAVPFRASIFRMWYEDRLMPWLHFVPQDGRLHAVHSTLAYFLGFKGTINGREVEMGSKFREAQFIADQGRKWAERALRKEDAEAYFFRLLLEWGRLVDDRRDELGFQMGL